MKKSVIGITGGIASGKSYVCSVIKEQGFSVIDADEISRELSKKGNPIFERIIEVFGKDYLTTSGELDRQKFGKMIFENTAARNKLNAISHPLIIEEMKKEIDKNSSSIIFLAIPLLFEAKLSRLCDKIVCVYVDRVTQLQRLMWRDGISEAYALNKINAQLCLEEKKAMSDYVVDSRGSFNHTKDQVIDLIHKIKEDTHVDN